MAPSRRVHAFQTDGRNLRGGGRQGITLNPRLKAAGFVFDCGKSGTNWREFQINRSSIISITSRLELSCVVESDRSSRESLRVSRSEESGGDGMA